MTDGELTDQEVTSGFVNMIYDQKKANDPLDGQHLKVRMIEWDRAQCKFVIVTKEVTLGNCQICFSLAPLGRNCHNCRGVDVGPTMILHFTNSASALHMSRSTAPPEWFTDRYPACNPVRMAEYLELGTKPYFDALRYEEQETYPSYEAVGTHMWKPVHMSTLIEAYLEGAYYHEDNDASRIEEYLHHATNCHPIELYDCMLTHGAKFPIEIWDMCCRV